MSQHQMTSDTTTGDETTGSAMTNSTPPRPRSHLSVPGKHSRREFLRRAGLVAGAGVAAPYALELSGLANDEHVAAATPYRALVCVFLYGGNDSSNTFVPWDHPSYQRYASVRGGQTRGRGGLLPLGAPGGASEGRELAMVPEFGGLKGLYDAGQLAVLSNVGTLVRPLDKASYEVESNRPPQLFSHNDQSSLWQSSAPEGSTSGWGGRLGDLLLDDNGSDSLFTCISAAGNAVMMSGRRAVQYHVSWRGVVEVDLPLWSDEVTDGVNAILSRAPDGRDLFGDSHALITRRSLAASDKMIGAIDAAGDVPRAFPETGLGGQLRTVAQQIMAGRNHLEVKRQVVFVSMGGFDNHDGLNQNHPALLVEVNDALLAFHQTMQDLGISREVTAFTASDFGRTLVSNGNGTDHGWGSHQIILGGDVRGGRTYGRIPTLDEDGPDDVGQGRALPDTSVDQYSATLAKWMGASGLPTAGRMTAEAPSLPPRRPDAPTAATTDRPLTQTGGPTPPISFACQIGASHRTIRHANGTVDRYPALWAETVSDCGTHATQISHGTPVSSGDWSPLR